jgi:putative ABC transport system ATP-binding protein/lipoprotein-releasing system ATP-binding protein
VQVGKRQILSGVDLEVDTGQVVAVLGSSGSGKTTLLSCLGGLREPSSGTVVVDGRPLSRMRARERARTRLELIGFVYQHADLLPELSPIENIMLPALLAGTGYEEARAAAVGLTEDLGVRTTADTADLSGGEAQRLALARALITRPKLLLADEPTGSLDEATRDSVLSLMFSYVRSANLGAVLVTHDRSVANLADATVTLEAPEAGTL